MPPPLSALALTPSKSIASLLTAAAATSNPCRLQTTVYTDGNGAVWGNNTPKGIVGIDLVSVKGTEISRQEILDGLYAGDKIVVHPVLTLWMTQLHNVNGGDACCAVSKPKE